MQILRTRSCQVRIQIWIHVYIDLDAMSDCYGRWSSTQI